MTGKTYFSVTKFTDAVLKNDSKVEQIILPFVPERQKSDKFGQFYVEPIAIIMKYNKNKTTVVSYETMIKTYGLPIIKFTESKYRKINFRSDMQIFKIRTEEKEFSPNKDNESTPDQTSFSYYPSTIVDSNILSRSVITKMQELKAEYLSNNDIEAELDEDANFI